MNQTDGQVAGARGSFSMKKQTACWLPLWRAAICLQIGCFSASAAENLALGKPVAFTPAPSYGLTAKGDTDATDLTDGKLSARMDNQLWFDSACVGWSYPGLAQLSVDLGKTEFVGEVSIRFQGGSPQAGVAFPGWVDLLASLDGESFFKIASYSKWAPDDRAKFGLPQDQGKGWVHPLVFADANVQARYLGLSFYGTALNVSDELVVTRGRASLAKKPDVLGMPAPFARAGISIYWHKPTLMFSRNIVTGNPVGVLVAPGLERQPFEVVLDLPEGMDLISGGFGNAQAGAAIKTRVGNMTRCTFNIKGMTSQKAAGTLYFSGDWQAGQRGKIQYLTWWTNGATPKCSIDVEAVEIPQCPARPKRLMLGLGWHSLGAAMSWPNALDAFEAIGFTTVPLFARWTDFSDLKVQSFLDECRRRGFQIVNVDSPLHHMLAQHKRDRTIYCQFADGSVGTALCPSYRGPHFEAEARRLAAETARARASYLTCDIELLGWRGPADSAKCTRCQADFRASGHKDLSAWQQEKGYEIWKRLSESVRQAMERSGLPMPDMGGYDFRPGSSYQSFWPFDRLYPGHMHSSQVSTYTPLEPYHLALVGDEVRRDRMKMPRSDVLPWITPGDAGTFPGEAFRLALLECFVNGARGVYFWSGRVWDTETLAAFARAIRNIAPVEDVIVDGELLEGAEAAPKIRISGMRHGGRMVVLAADYDLAQPGMIQLRLPVKRASQVIDLDTGERLGTMSESNPVLNLALGPARARLLMVQPQE